MTSTTDTTALGKIEFSDVEESCLLTFYCHVLENQRTDPILKDPSALAIAEKITPLLAASPGRLQRSLATGKIRNALVVHICLRAKRYDDYARVFLSRHPDAAIVNIGCGIDTRFDRIDNGKVKFYDLDLPEVISFKKKLVKETPRYHLIASSVFNFTWMEEVLAGHPEHVLFLVEGVFMYCEPPQVKSLVLEMQRRFPASEMVCEVVNKRWVSPFAQKLLALKMQTQLKMGKDSLFRFGVTDGTEMEYWHDGITFLDEWSYFDSNHPRLGAMSLLGKSKSMRYTQWTVHYRLS